MARIFLALAVLSTGLLLGNLCLALITGDFGASSESYARARGALRALEASPAATIEEVQVSRDEVARLASAVRQQRERYWPHIWLGIVASLVALLVNSISITYFIGTSRWCREVVEVYRMPVELASESQRLKRRSFPWALCGILMTLAIAALGAAADPYASTANPAAWVIWHWAAAMAGVVLISIAFLVQMRAVTANHRVIQTILAEAQRMRDENDPPAHDQ